MPSWLPACWCLCALGAGCAPTEPLQARRPAVERGVALGLFASEPNWDYGPLLDEVVALGATDVQLDVIWLQTDVRSVDIARDPRVTAPDEVVARTIAQARARGLRVTLFPIVRPRLHVPGEWRGVMAPSAGVDAWFKAYAAFVLTMAELAERTGAERLSVGSELCSLERHEAHWRALIADVRAKYRGALLYSANWDQLDAVRFWDALDVAGTTAYFELAKDDGRVGVEQVRAAWAAPLEELREFSRFAGRPLVITEVGYPAHAQAARAPWDETRRAPSDLALQAMLTRVSCEALRDAPFVAGVTWWNWFGHGGAGDTGYTPRGKPAARELARCFARP
jgi:hypothetical protein